MSYLGESGFLKTQKIISSLVSNRFIQMDIKKLHDLFLKCDIMVDTRSNCKGSLFFALKGGNFNGTILHWNHYLGANYVR